ncbi:MAG: hypothetical protein AB7U20_25085 [Planctomycetaceae bacterium]
MFIPVPSRNAVVAADAVDRIEFDNDDGGGTIVFGRPLLSSRDASPPLPLRFGREDLAAVRDAVGAPPFDLSAVPAEPSAIVVSGPEPPKPPIAADQ